ncbi:hypothetical protein F8388_005945 [Cannabis sativa]|uniref:Uncharacterized protein n=1 Tax=Cannabis sativa TaxID=3483 RepID=A0A7J6E1P8_CANSA|nr:hypothetical protein F8388_005945 [Cannabis sativa]
MAALVQSTFAKPHTQLPKYHSPLLEYFLIKLREKDNTEFLQPLTSSCTHHHQGQSSNDVDDFRLKKLAAFQRKAVEHAFSFYSTCSIYEVENYAIIKSVLSLASSFGFQLEAPIPQWPSETGPKHRHPHHTTPPPPLPLPLPLILSQTRMLACIRCIQLTSQSQRLCQSSPTSAAEKGKSHFIIW